jgi:hypothetical protein
MVIPSCFTLATPLLGCCNVHRGNFADYFVHLLRREASHGLRTDISQSAHAGGEAGDGFIVRGLCRKHGIIHAHGPINIPNFDAKVRGGVDQTLRPFRGLPDIADALVGEVYENNVRGHRILLGLTKQKSRSTLAKNRKSNRLGSSIQPQIQKPIKVGEALDRYVDRKSIARRKQTVKIIEFHDNSVPT